MNTYYTRFLLFISLIALGFSHEAKAQFSFDADTAYIHLESGTKKFGYINVTYNGSNPSDFYWREIDTDLLWDRWTMEFCECTSCYTNDFGNQFPDSVECTNAPDGMSVEWKVGIDAEGVVTAGNFYQVELVDRATGTRDTLTWISTTTASAGSSLADELSQVKPVYAGNGLTLLNQGNENMQIQLISLTGAVLIDRIIQPGANHVDTKLLPSGLVILKSEQGKSQRVFIK